MGQTRLTSLKWLLEELFLVFLLAAFFSPEGCLSLEIMDDYGSVLSLRYKTKLWKIPHKSCEISR